MKLPKTITEKLRTDPDPDGNCTGKVGDKLEIEWVSDGKWWLTLWGRFDREPHDRILRANGKSLKLALDALEARLLAGDPYVH